LPCLCFFSSQSFPNLYIASSPSFHPPVAQTSDPYSITGLPTTSHTLNASFVPRPNVCRSISTFLILPSIFPITLFFISFHLGPFPNSTLSTQSYPLLQFSPLPSSNSLLFSPFAITLHFCALNWNRHSLLYVCT